MNEIFIQGAINPMIIADCLNRLSAQEGIGGQGIFLGQVRNDLIDGKRVCAIEYNAYQEMAVPVIQQIKDQIRAKYGLISVNVLHSLGNVRVGELCLFVLTASAHRKYAFESCQEAVERIKSEVPIWGKELFDNDSYVWKVNT